MKTFSDEGINLGEQLIVVLPDKAIDAMEKESCSNGDDNFFSNITDALLSFISFRRPFAVVIAEQVIDVLKAYAEAQRNGANIKTVRESAAKLLNFPPGHPRHGVVYAQHPASELVYYTAASFHRLAFEHKFSESIRLLSALGAKEIQVNHGRGWNKDFGFDFSVPASDVIAGAKAKHSQKIDEKLLFTATLKGHCEPELPDSLIWYQHEPAWQAIAESRIHHGLENFSLSLSYIDDYGINGGLKIAAGKAGLDLGGNFQDHEATVWHVSGTFA